MIEKSYQVDSSTIQRTQLILSPAEVKLILRLRQLANTGKASQVLIDLRDSTLYLVGGPENLRGQKDPIDT